MAPKGRYLRSNAGTECPSNLVFFDTESVDTVQAGQGGKKVLTLRIWCAISCRIEKDKVTRREFKHGTTKAEFWQWLQSNNRSNCSYYCFSHNIGNDLTQLGFWQELDDGRFQLRYANQDGRDKEGVRPRVRNGRLCVDGHPTYIVCFHQRTTFKFVDTCNYWPKKLHSIGESVGLHKLKRPDKASDDDDWGRYCQRNCEIVLSAVTNMLLRWKRESCGVFQLTAPSLAMTNFRHLCDVRADDGKSIDIVCKPGAREHVLERDSYYGGRTVCFHVGSVRGAVYHYDCNSLYPYVMQTNSFPRRFVRFYRGGTIDELASTTRVYGVVARVFIKSRNNTFPVRVDGKQYHCTGQFWTVLCGRELQRAIDTESISRIGTVQVYSVAPLFRKWVDYWYGRKLEAIARGPEGLGELEFVKLILNSLSGKWAQHGRYWQDRPDRIPPRRWGAWVEYNAERQEYSNWRAVAGHSQIQTSENEPEHSFPAISAFITAAAREYMREIIESLPPGSVYYSATDSIFCDRDGSVALQSMGVVSQDAIGHFRLVGEHRQGHFFGPNHYMLDGKWTVAGHQGKYLESQATDGRVELLERLPSFITTGPRDFTVISSVPVRPIRHDYRGIISSVGQWVPYRLSLDPEWTDRPVSYADLQEY